MKKHSFLALDLGAGSGRAIVGTLENGRLMLDEVHRFANTPFTSAGTLYWDFAGLCDGVVEGIAAAVRGGYELDGMAVDTWGVDFGLLDDAGRPMGNPVCYRDGRTLGMAHASDALVSLARQYAVAGMQQMDINTAYQLLALVRSGDGDYRAARRLLFTPDLINYMLAGSTANEYTIASTSGLVDACTRGWSDALIGGMGLRRDVMGDIVMPGALLGRLLPSVATRTGAGSVPVYAVGSHDTASAIAAIAATGDDWAFLSSGTWSLLGMPLGEPVLTSEAAAANFTNEGGVDGRILFMRNITGLWLLQRLAEQWHGCSYEELVDDCAGCEPLRSIVDSDHPDFNNPESMEDAIVDFCRREGQPAPRTRGEFVRCVLESLALKYRDVVADLERLTGRKIEKLHVVGGGSRNKLLNQLTADFTGLEVVTGLEEGTAVGNIMQQAVAAGAVPDWDSARQIIRESFLQNVYRPNKNTIK